MASISAFDVLKPYTFTDKLLLMRKVMCQHY